MNFAIEPARRRALATKCVDGGDDEARAAEGRVASGINTLRLGSSSERMGHMDRAGCTANRDSNLVEDDARVVPSVRRSDCQRIRSRRWKITSQIPRMKGSVKWAERPNKAVLEFLALEGHILASFFAKCWQAWDYRDRFTICAVIRENPPRLRS
jgi:hypothetical protein